MTTFTTLHPRRRRLLDDFRERMDEEVSAGTIRHQGDDWGDGSIASLAWGARVSAAIPGVFEPVYPTFPAAAAAINGGGTAYPIPSFGTQLTVGGQSGRRRLGAAWRSGQQPPARRCPRAIFAQPSDGEVRRAVLCVSPTSAANRPGAPLL
ncbi:MAG: hypothetical protein IPN45_09620 [Actinomycetales bacterium]|nr:hypothetical protein [Actinomycetales bacterium]